jgi:F-type H+-transporting ATPase subunit delta
MAFGRIASRYSKSLLEIAQGNNELDKVKADMDAVQQICMNSKDLISLLNNPIVKTADKKAVLQKIFASLGKTTQSFISFFGRPKQRSNTSDDCRELYQSLQYLERN